MAQAVEDAVVTLDAEHDRHVWLSAADAARRCRPMEVAKQILAVHGSLAE